MFENVEALILLFTEEKLTVLENMVSRADFRYSLDKHAAYLQINLLSFGTLLYG